MGNYNKLRKLLAVTYITHSQFFQIMLSVLTKQQEKNGEKPIWTLNIYIR